MGREASETVSAISSDTRFCSLCAREAGLDPIGSADSYRHLLAVEIPLPWPLAMYERPGPLPEELIELRRRQIEAYYQGQTLSMTAFAIAPDAAYSQPGMRRVLSFRRPEGAFAAFAREEYLAPEAELGPLCWALLFDHDRLPDFARYRLPDTGTRDLMVCTHGNVDAACAKFGFPLYRDLRRLADESGGRLRAWRVSHFGGHVFAPTLIDMPEFRYWAYVDRETAELLATRRGDIARLRGCYRGWAGLESPLLQAAERELLLRFGWAWLGYLKQGKILAQGEATASGEPAWAEVRIDYAAPDGRCRGTCLARVELERHIATPHSSNSPETYPYPQYTVAWLRDTQPE